MRPAINLGLCLAVLGLAAEAAAQTGGSLPPRRGAPSLAPPPAASNPGAAWAAPPAVETGLNWLNNVSQNAARNSPRPGGLVPVFTADNRGGTGGPLKVSKGSGVLPNDAGQVWREYDISPYTSRVSETSRPEHAIVDWILRETGTEVWFSEPLGILSASRNVLRVYHTPEMQRVVQDLVERFTSSEAQAHVLGIRLVTVSNPNWRVRALPLMRPVDVQSPGVDAWLLSKENAAVLLGDLRRRADFHEHNAPNLQIQNGQTQTLSRLRPRTYVRSVRLRPEAWPGYELTPAQLDEGFSLQISPLMSLDGRTVDAVLKCHVDQIERLAPINVDVPAGGQLQRVQIQVPQLVSWRLHERFRWPADQVLLLSCGVVASPTPDAPAGIGASLVAPLMGTAAPRADALLFIDHVGRASQVFYDTPFANGAASGWNIGGPQSGGFNPGGGQASAFPPSGWGPGGFNAGQTPINSNPASFNPAGFNSAGFSSGSPSAFNAAAFSGAR